MKKFLIIITSLVRNIAAARHGRWNCLRIASHEGFGYRTHPVKLSWKLDFSQPIIEDAFQRSVPAIHNSRKPASARPRPCDRSSLRWMIPFRELSRTCPNCRWGCRKFQDVRDAVQRFSATGKWTIAYADTFFSSKTGTGVYYLASAFDEIYHASNR